MILIRHHNRGPVDQYFGSRLASCIERINGDLMDVASAPINTSDLSEALLIDCNERFAAWRAPVSRDEYAAAFGRWVAAGELSATLLVGAHPLGGYWAEPLLAMRLNYVISMNGARTPIAFQKSLHPALSGGRLSDDEPTNYRLVNDGDARIAEVLL